jgi:hypothetical protein
MFTMSPLSVYSSMAAYEVIPTQPAPSISVLVVRIQVQKVAATAVSE